MHMNIFTRTSTNKIVLSAKPKPNDKQEFRFLPSFLVLYLLLFKIILWLICFFLVDLWAQWDYKLVYEVLYSICIKHSHCSNI